MSNAAMEDDVAAGGGGATKVEAPAPVSAEDEARATQLKDEGNEFFKAGHFKEALEKYSEALEVLPSAVLYGNRAFANLKMENFGAALQDASKALELDPDYVKGNYRRGSAFLALGKYKEARKELRAVVRKKPKDKNARQRLEECERAIRRMMFEAAIEREQTKPVWERVDFESMEVEDSYDGPRMTEPMSLSFVHEMMEHFRLQKVLHRKYVMQMLFRLRGMMRSYESLVHVTVPESVEREGAAGGGSARGSPMEDDDEGEHEERKGVDPASRRRGVLNVCGDTHGQYYDLLNIFKINGEPSPSNPYVFNGDFVDRGSFSVENVLTLFAFKLLYPEHVHLTRGNHETTAMNKVYSFEGEVLHKYEQVVMEMFTDVFHALPLGVVVHSERQDNRPKVLIIHGGLPSEDGVTLEDISKTYRFREPPESGIMTDVLWSDPQPFPGRGPSKRGTGKSFGPDITQRFLESNGLELLIRSHEVKDEGYHVEHNGRCITVFSAPNYCDSMGNKGAIVKLDPDCNPSFVQFTAVAHPPMQPMAYATGFSRLLGMG